MASHVCPWWGGYFIDNRARRWIHNPEKILAPYVRPGMTALDFGCGMGMFAIALAKLVGEQGRVIAADLQPQMLRVVERRAAQAGVADRLRTHRCEADLIGIAEPLDFVLAFYSAHEVSDQRRLLNEIYGFLRPTGRFLIVEPKGHVTPADFQQTLALAREIGFVDQEEPPVRWSRAVVLGVRPNPGPARCDCS